MMPDVISIQVMKMKKKIKFYCQKKHYIVSMPPYAFYKFYEELKAHEDERVRYGRNQKSN